MNSYNDLNSASKPITGSMKGFMNLFTGIFLGVGLIFLGVGLVWGYSYFTDPQPFEEDDEWVGPLVLGIMGFVFSAIGGGIRYYMSKQRARKEMLKRSGRRLRAMIIRTYYDTSVTFRSGQNVQHPLIVECEADLSGRKQTFKSDQVWNKTDFTEGNEITVYIDTRDYTNYWVDTGEI
jgi:hypothetical protein